MTSTVFMTPSQWNEASEICIILMEDWYGSGWRATYPQIFYVNKETLELFTTDSSYNHNTLFKCVATDYIDNAPKRRYANIQYISGTGLKIPNYEWALAASGNDNNRVSVYYR